MADMGSGARNTAIKKVLVPATTYYLSLHTTSPGTTGAHEVTGGSYARQAIKFGTPSTGKETSTDAQTFPTMPAVTVKGIGIWTASTSGTFIWGATVTTKSVPSGAKVTVASGAVTATIG